MRSQACRSLAVLPRSGLRAGLGAIRKREREGDSRLKTWVVLRYLRIRLPHFLQPSLLDSPATHSLESWIHIHSPLHPNSHFLTHEWALSPPIVEVKARDLDPGSPERLSQVDPRNRGRGFWLAPFNCPHLWESLMYLPGLAQEGWWGQQSKVWEASE